MRRGFACHRTHHHFSLFANSQLQDDIPLSSYIGSVSRERLIRCCCLALDSAVRLGYSARITRRRTRLFSASQSGQPRAITTMHPASGAVLTDSGSLGSRSRPSIIPPIPSLQSTNLPQGLAVAFSMPSRRSFLPSAPRTASSITSTCS